MPHGCALHFPIKIKHTGTLRELFCLRGLRLNLPEFTWSVSCSIVTDQRGRRANMTIEYTFHVLDILSYPVSTKEPTMLGLREKHFEIKALRWLDNAILKFDFANKVFH